MPSRKTPDTPGGRASVHAAINALPERRTSKRPDSVKAQTDFLLAPYGAVVLASQARKMSLAAYVRRATYAMAAHDLGLPLSDLLERDPRVTRETGFAIDDPDGVKFGHWEIERLIGEADHDSDHGTAR